MADHTQQQQQQPPPAMTTNETDNTVVGNSVVHDLMRVYENLTQSSTPQVSSTNNSNTTTTTEDASTTLSHAYNNNNNNNSNGHNELPPPQSQPIVAATPTYQVPVGYPIPPPVFPASMTQQQPPQHHQQHHHQMMDSNDPNRNPNYPLHPASQSATNIPTQQQPPSYNYGTTTVTADGLNVVSYQQFQQQQQQVGGTVYVPTLPTGSSPVAPGSDGVVVNNTQIKGEGSTTDFGTANDGGSSSSQIIKSTSSNLTLSKSQPSADASSESDDKSGGAGRSRRKRKQQDGSGGDGKKKGSGRGKKSKKEDGRWSKRFTWPEDLHRDFVSAIFDVGLKHSSPSTILEHMPKHEQITTERIKSHLQKYRLHRVKSKKEFISSYEASLRNFQNHNTSSNSLVTSNGEVAAHLTSVSLGPSSGNKKDISNNNNINKTKKEDASNTNIATVARSSDDALVKQSPRQQQNNNDSLMLPQLTEAEKQSPIGAAMGYLMGLFFSLKQQLMIQRSLEAAGEKAKGNAMFPVGNANNPTTAATVAATAAAVAAGVEFTADGSMQQPQQAGGVGGVAVSIRTNIEENSMMKREMQNQMALQNKMRALKQQELAKYNNISNSEGGASTVITTAQHNTNPHLTANDGGSNEGDFAAGAATGEQQQHQQVSSTDAAAQQGAGEMAGNDLSDGHMVSIENNDYDFWQSDVVDEQLFEFLMDN
jgi:SHAQKYF class myb-like DNA-binding protein